jgi:hypothetical protein
LLEQVRNWARNPSPLPWPPKQWAPQAGERFKEEKRRRRRNRHMFCRDVRPQDPKIKVG